MPDTISDLDVQKWKGRIALAAQYMEKYGDTDGRWKRNVKAMAGDFGSKEELGQEAIDVNITHSTLQTMLPPVWITDPHVTVHPVTARYEGEGKSLDNIRGAELNEVELNYWIKELGLRNVGKRCALDAYATNLGYAYVGYIKKKKEVEADGERIEPDPLVKHKQPFIRRIGPRDVLVPPGYAEFEECPWIAIRWTRPIAYVKARFGEVANEIKPTRSLVPDEKGVTSAALREYAETDDAEVVDYFQVWDKQTRKVITVTDSIEKELDYGDWPWDAEGFPVEQIRIVDVPDEYWGTPPTSFFYQQNKELNACRTAMRKRFNRSKDVVLATGDISDEAKEAYKKADDGEIITAGASGANIAATVMHFPPPPPDSNVLAYEATVKGDLREISGLGAEQRGSGDPNIESATASANVEKWAQIRASDLGDRMRMFYLGIVRKLWMILKQFPDEKRSRLIAGPAAGQFARLEYTLGELEGEYQFDLDISAMMADNPATRLTRALANYNLMRADPKVRPDLLILDVFKAQNVASPESYIVTFREPAEEYARALSALPSEAQERDDHQRHMQEHDADMGRIEAALSRMDPQSPMGEKLRTALLLLMTHYQDHVRYMQMMASQVQPGKPIAENALRQQFRGVAGSETQAELAGSPLAGPSMPGPIQVQ